MADLAAADQTAAAVAQQSGQSSSSDGSQSQQTAAPAAPADGSATPPAVAARPDWLPADHWDGDKNTFKPEFGQHYRDLAARDAERATRAATLPAEPGQYKAELPTDFVVPEGLNFELNPEDPLFAQAQALAHEWDQGKISGQQAFSKLLALHAGAQVGQQQFLKQAHDAEVAKLGATGPAQVDALKQWLGARVGPDAVGVIMPSIVTAAQVKVWQQVMQLVSSQGAASIPANGRADADQGIPNYERMSFEQKRAAQDAARSRH